MPIKASKPIPDGIQSVTPVINFTGDCAQAIDFYKKAFGAEVVGDIAKAPDGKVLHAMIKIGDSNVMLSDVMGPAENAAGLRGNLWLYVDNCDSIFNRAAGAGCKVVWPLIDQFWGDRAGTIIDPFGHQWSIATLKWILTPQEMKEKQAEWFASLKR